MVDGGWLMVCSFENSRIDVPLRTRRWKHERSELGPQSVRFLRGCVEDLL